MSFHGVSYAGGQCVHIASRFPAIDSRAGDQPLLALRASSSFIRSSIKCCHMAAPGSKTRRPVSRVLFAVLPRSGSHSSGMPVTRHLTRHTRGTGVKQPICAPYSVLLRAGFTVPVLSPGLRWALTPPFHPYLSRRGGGLLSVALSLGSRRAAVSRRPVSLEPGLSSSTQLPAHQRLPGRLV